MEAYPHDVSALAEKLFGLIVKGQPRRLQGTTDDVFLICSSDKFIMRISLENETYENLSFQNGVLDDLSRWPLGFSVPKPVPSIDQRLIELVKFASATRFVRLFSYVPGHSVSSVKPSAALLQDVGRSVAAMGVALASVPRHMPPQNLVWSISNALDLLPLVPLLSPRKTRPLAARAFENFERRTLPLLDRLRHQIIHGDFNANNVLIESPHAQRVGGVIDFGDLTFGPRVNDLAIAAASHCAPADPVPGILAVCSGYTLVTRLLPEETDAIFDLICLRDAMRLSFWAGQAAEAGQRLSPAIEEPATMKLAMLLETDARERVHRLLSMQAA